MTRLSCSAKDKYDLCPYKYYLHYEMRYRSSLQSSALCFGSAIDVSLNWMLEGNDDFHSVFDSEWSKYEGQNENIEYYKSDLDEALLTDTERNLPIAMQNFVSLRRKGHLLLESYNNNVLPRIKEVVSVQGEVNIVGYDSDGGVTQDSIYGKLDLIAMIELDDGSVHQTLLDNKTTSKPYAKNSVLKNHQLALYASGFPDIEWFGYATMNKKTFGTQLILDKIPEIRKEEVLSGFVDTLTKIKNLEFERNKKSCYAFGRRCEFYSHCHNDFFGKDIYIKTEEN